LDLEPNQQARLKKETGRFRGAPTKEKDFLFLNSGLDPQRICGTSLLNRVGIFAQSHERFFQGFVPFWRFLKSWLKTSQMVLVKVRSLLLSQRRNPELQNRRPGTRKPQFFLNQYLSAGARSGLRVR